MYLDTAVKIGGAIYGLALISTAFQRSKITETLRLDRLVIPNAGESTRPLNYIIGMLMAGYYFYSLLGAYMVR